VQQSTQKKKKKFQLKRKFSTHKNTEAIIK